MRLNMSHGGLCHSTYLHLMALLGLMIMPSHHILAKVMDPIKIKSFMREHDIPFEDIQYYWKTHPELSKLQNNMTRLFPLCINSKNIESRGHESLQKWVHILQKMETAYDCGKRAIPANAFNESDHLSSHHSDWIKSITLNRVYSPDEDARNMRQWMYIKVTTSSEVEGLFMQSIVGKLGLPSGEFSFERLICGIQSASNSKIEHCGYRARAEINHPTVYFGQVTSSNSKFSDSPSVPEGPDNIFEVNYRWNDITCMESPYLQFILLPVKHFNQNATINVDFKPLLSPVYTNMGFDSPDGLPTPYYEGWNTKMECSTEWTKTSSALYHDSVAAALPWIINEDLQRLPFNEEYERCLILTSQNKERNEVRRECPPGPFECSEGQSFETIVRTSGINEIADERQDYFNKMQVTSKLPCLLPSADSIDACSGNTTNKFIPPYIDFTELLNSSDDARIHGAICILVYMVIFPISNFIGRFFRGTVIVGWWTYPIDFWIILHAVLHIVGWLLIWASLGFVSSGNEAAPIYAEECYITAFHADIDLTPEQEDEQLKKLDDCVEKKLGIHLHSKLGMAAVCLSTAMMISGVVRNHKTHLRNIEITIHSHVGNALYFYSIGVAVIAAGSLSCYDTIIWLFVMMTSTIVFNILATWLSFHEDEKIGVIPERYVWPILEHIKLFDKSPTQHIKVTLLWIYSGILLALWGMICFSYSLISASEDRIFAGLPNGKGGDSHYVEGLFSTCRASELKLSWPNFTNI